MAVIITHGVEYQQLLDDLRALIRHEINHSAAGAPVPPAEEQLLTVKDAAALLDVGVHTVHEWKRKGLLPFVKMGSRTYFKRAALLASLQDQQRSLKGKGRGRG